MSKTSHMTMKELKHDAVQDVGKSAFDYVRDHSTKILTAIGVVVLIVAVIQIATGLQARRGREASQAIMQARTQYRNAAMISDPTERDRTLQTAIQECMNVRTQYSSSEAARHSYLVEGHCETLRGDLEKAMAAYQQFLANAKTPLEKAQGHLVVGQTYENQYFMSQDNKSLLESAISEYQTAAAPDKKGQRSYLAWEAMLDLGRAQRMAGNLAEAKTIYQKIIEERPYYEAQPEKDEEATDETTREGQAKMLRENLREALAMASFESQAKTELEKVEALMK